MAIISSYLVLSPHFSTQSLLILWILEWDGLEEGGKQAEAGRTQAWVQSQRDWSKCELRIFLCGKTKWFGTGRRANWDLPEMPWGIWIGACGLLNCNWWVCKGASTLWASMPISICQWLLNPAKPCCRLVLLYQESFEILPDFLVLLVVPQNHFKLWLFKRIVQCLGWTFSHIPALYIRAHSFMCCVGICQ